MTARIDVNLGDRSYPIFVAADYSGMGKCLKEAGISGKLAVITDSNVDKHLWDRFRKELGTYEDGIFKHVIPAGEASKNLDTVKEIYKFLFDLRLDRSSTIAALGGGVTGDIAGFAAATFLRGINFVQVPTSLLAQADSSVGGKVGVDFEGGKNMIGAFYQPKLVYANVGSLSTLPEREFKSGLAEVVKHGMIADAGFFSFLEDNMDAVLGLDAETLKYVVKTNCSIKSGVVEKDEKESGLRAILNFGHTTGHAVESASGFKMLHGECVSVGIVAACKMAQYLGMIDDSVLRRAEAILGRIGLPVAISGIDPEDILNRMLHDKKIKNGRLTFVLPKKIGEVERRVIDDHGLIRKVLREITV